MYRCPDFQITSTQAISALFKQRNILSFKDAAEFTRQLPYGRNTNKQNLSTVFSDNCGTCGTKHALLKQLIDENRQPGFRLMIGIFKMSGNNTPQVRKVLEKYNLKYIPEAHNYLRYEDEVIDCTATKPMDFIGYLLEEVEINPSQITAFKVSYHKKHLSRWLETENIGYSQDEIWNIREACIEALSQR